MSQLDEFEKRVRDALDGKLGNSEQERLREDIRSAYGFNSHATAIYRSTERTWSDTLAAIGAYRDGLDHEIALARAQSTSLSATATATASASAYADAVSGLESMGSLSDDDKAELEKLMLEVRSAKDESMLEHAAKTLMDEAIEKGVDTLPYVLPVIVQAVQGMLGA